MTSATISDLYTGLICRKNNQPTNTNQNKPNKKQKTNPKKLPPQQQAKHEFSNLQYTLHKKKLGRLDRAYKAVVNRVELVFQTSSAFKFFGT